MKLGPSGALLLLACGLSPAQDWDVGARLAAGVSEATSGSLKLTFEERGRYESRTANAFGKDPDLETGLFRTRVGLTYRPVEWLRVSGMMQDSRAPWYGPNPPNTVQDQADLHESWIELFPSAKKGFGMSAGRAMLNYGDGRLIGTPQWSNLSRTYDNARVYWRSARVRIEMLMVSPVKIRIGEFNRPVLGDRVWGTYNVFPKLAGEHQADAYLLRRYQNRIGGFSGGTRAAGTDRLGVTTAGLRLAGPVAAGVKYTLEAALQRGKVGPAELRSSAAAASLTRRWTVRHRALNATAEYKYASGSHNPADVLHTGTFDQLYAANHDKFGHEDLFGWRNIHDARGLVTYALTKSFSVNFMYNELWLAAARDGLYNGSGKQIARSATGAAGSHVGREADLFGTYKYGHFLFGAGYGHFVPGRFVRATSPGVGPAYLYVFHTYSL